MKRLLSILILLSLQSAGAESIHPEALARYLPSQKASINWSGSQTDPLRVEFTLKAKKKTLHGEEEVHVNAIKSMLQSRGIQGLVLGRGPVESKLLMDGHIFTAADELQFTDTSGTSTPIYAGRSVIVLEITEDKGVFYVSGDNESPAENGIQFEIEWEDFFKV